MSDAAKDFACFIDWLADEATGGSRGLLIAAMARFDFDMNFRLDDFDVDWREAMPLLAISGHVTSTQVTLRMFTLLRDADEAKMTG